MKQVIHIGATVWRNKHGNAILEVTDIDPQDTSSSLNRPTIGAYKQRAGSLKISLKHPVNGIPFTLDLSPWSHLPDDTRLRLIWKFIVDRTASPINPK